MKNYSQKALLAIIVILVFMSPIIFAETIPLTNGRIVNVEILRRTNRGVQYRYRNGSAWYNWNLIDKSYKYHPQHSVQVEKNQLSYNGSVQRNHGVRFAFGTNHKLTVYLFLILVLFWANILSLKIIDKQSVVQGYFWNIVALVAGPIAVIVLFSKYGVWKTLFSKKLRIARKVDSVSNTVASALFTWDGELINPQKGNKQGSGLRLILEILGEAAKIKASDVHFDATETGITYKYRVDGTLRSGEVISFKDGKKAVSALKMAAGMDVARRHENQDGACHFNYGNISYDLRLSRAWAVNGETIVIRLLQAGGMGDKFTDLGMIENMADTLTELITETAGLMIIAGPTGSGKTSTIYALLKKIVGTGRNLLTIEDPVEYRIEDATQISLNTKAGLTFASALRASMRHDPDVILVGEIRDSETMSVAFQAALTGHLVFTTIHATSILATFGRLQELGLSTYMINTGLKTVVCQRLIRVLCPSCKESYLPNADDLKKWGLTEEENQANLFYRAVGCELCSNTGFHGRIAVMRMLVMNDFVRATLKKEMVISEIHEAVNHEAIGTLGDYLVKLLWTGVTTPKELLKTVDMFDLR